MSAHMTVYCDESGNDGPNYLSKEEPFYVLAGWLTPDSAIVDASVEMEQLRSTHCKDARELKFKTFRKKAPRTAALVESFRRLGDLGLIPTYLVAEKRFCIAAKIVETFLDPFYNPLLTTAMTFDAVTKKEIANTLYETLPESLLTQFAQAYRRPTAESLTAALKDVSAECERLVNRELAELIRGSRDKIADIAADELSAGQLLDSAGGTLNYPCLVGFLMLIENIARTTSLAPHRIVHDDQGPYQDAYLASFEAYRKAEKHLLYWDDQPIPSRELACVESFEIQSSHLQPMVQAADLLAGAAHHICARLQRDEPLSDVEQELASFVLPILALGEKTPFTFPICSRHMYSRIDDLLETVTGMQVSSDPVRSHVLPRTTSTDDDSQPKYSVTVPLFTITNVAEDRIAVVVPPEDCPQDCFIPIFTTADGAHKCHDDLEWSEPHHVKSFDYPEIDDLLDKLDALLPHAALLFIDGRPTLLSDFVANMKAVMDQSRRVVRTGMVDTVLKTHEFEGEKLTSILASSGQYVAMQQSTGRTCSASTRDDAVRQLKAQIGSAVE